MSMIELNVFGQKLSQFMIRPGAIFLLPVPYTLPYPTLFLHRMTEEIERVSSQKVKITAGNHWVDEETGQYYPGGASEIILGAKVRPVLLLKEFELKDVIWQGNHVLGLPVFSIKQRMRDDKAFYQRLTENRVKYFHYLAPENNPELGLSKSSYVLTIKPVVLLKEYFTHYLGQVNPSELYQIRGRYNKFS